jgi:hypothetical protein
MNIIHALFFSSYQERNTEKILYGLDDIKQARVVIIVCSRFAMQDFLFLFVANPFKPELTKKLLAFCPF